MLVANAKQDCSDSSKPSEHGLIAFEKPLPYASVRSPPLVIALQNERQPNAGYAAPECCSACDYVGSHSAIGSAPIAEPGRPAARRDHRDQQQQVRRAGTDARSRPGFLLRCEWPSARQNERNGL
jgi:hypothetical protein